MENQKNHFVNLGKAFHCSVGILFLCTAMNPTKYLYTQIMSKSNNELLGFIQYALNYFCAAIGCLASSYILDKFGVKWCLTISAIIDTLWILAIIPSALISENPSIRDSFIASDFFIYTSQTLIQIMQGLFLGIKWVAGNKYISQCATEETKGFYFSFFLGMYMLSIILGSLISAFISKSLHQSTYLFIMTILASLSIVLFYTLVQPIPQERFIPDDDDQTKDNEILIEQNSENSKILKNTQNYSAILEDPDLSNDYSQSNNSNFVQNTNLSETKIYLNQEVKEVLLLIKSRKMLPLIPLLLWVGISEAIYFEILLNIIIDTQSIGDYQYKISNSMLTMVTFGTGELIGSLFTGWMIDKYGNKKTVTINIVLVSIQTILKLIYLINYKFSWFAYFLTFVWGLQDGLINTLSIEMLGFEFKNNSQSYAVSNLGLCLSASLFSFIQGFVKGKEQYIIYTTIVGFIGILSNISALFFKFKPMPDQLKQSMKQDLNK
ncbi:major facilitator superfamily protein [Stylonychia lemnae]|uniref:Major facilitator superfamily protein n=1 Tax=Stylonychia lemnae TaxID=5949 RepID=A0A078ANB1_STYLE|nr:major facilitator superfamily protein [Stylonychia lemnae]|eukprot:CDW83659.1 major facilitator superfamily protein [Stylonychia lemnae]